MCGLNYATATALTLAAKALALLLAAATSVVLARGLGPEARGDYALITLVPLIAVTVANGGIGLAAIHRVGRTPQAAATAATNAIVFSLAASVATAGILAALAAPLRTLYPAAYSYLPLIVIAVPQALSYLLLQALLQATRAFVASAALVVVSYALQLAALSWLVLGAHLGLPGAVAAWFVAHLTVAIATAVVTWRTLGLAPFDPAALRADVTFGAVSWAGNIALLATTRASLLVAGAMLDAAQVGVLAMAIVLAELIWNVPEAAAFSLAPFVARFGEGRSELITPMVTRVVLALSAVAAVLVALVADWLVVALFGAEYADAAGVLRVLLPGIIGLAMAKVLAADLLGRGRPELTLRALLAAAAVAVLTSATLVPIAGPLGAAAASTIAYLVAGAALLATYVRVAGIAVGELLVPRMSDVSLLVRRGWAVIH